MKAIRTTFSCAGFIAVSMSELPDSWEDWGDDKKQAYIDELNLTALKENATSNSEEIQIDNDQ